MQNKAEDLTPLIPAAMPPRADGRTTSEYLYEFNIKSWHDNRGDPSQLRAEAAQKEYDEKRKAEREKLRAQMEADKEWLI